MRKYRLASVASRLLDVIEMEFTPESVTHLDVAVDDVETLLGSAVEHCEVITLHSGISAYVIRRPGLALSIPMQWRIYDALAEVDPTRDWAVRRREGYLERLAEFVLIADPARALIGWTGFHLLRFGEYSVVYLDSTGMLPNDGETLFGLVRSRLYNAAMPRCAPDRPVYLAAGSEAPRVHRMLSRMLLEGELLFPHPVVPTPSHVKRVASRIAIWLGQTDVYEPQTLRLSEALLLVGRLR